MKLSRSNYGQYHQEWHSISLSYIREDGRILEAFQGFLGKLDKHGPFHTCWTGRIPSFLGGRNHPTSSILFLFACGNDHLHDVYWCMHVSWWKQKLPEILHNSKSSSIFPATPFETGARKGDWKSLEPPRRQFWLREWYFRLPAAMLRRDTGETEN